MQSIGNKLQEARQAKNLIIKTVSIATKIREDFLEKMEKDAFDEIPLPEIYVRGFLTAYAKHLGIDHQEILAQYYAIQNGGDDKKVPVERESLGYLDMPEEQSKPTPSITAPTGEPVKPKDEDDRDDLLKSSEAEVKQPYPAENDSKAGDGFEAKKPFSLPSSFTAILGALAVTVIVVILLARIFSSDDIRQPSDRLEQSQEGVANAAIEEVTFLATGDVALKVTQVRGDKLLFSDYLSEGETVTLEKEGEALIAFTEGKNLVIKRDGKETAIPIEGPGRISVP